MTIFDDLTINDFKQQFPRFTPVYLPYYRSKTYFFNDVVYYRDKFYQCIVENTNNNPTVTTDWKLYNSSVLNYTQDSDIENAIREAKVNFNEDLFGDTCTTKMIFLYLVAYYLTNDFQTALNSNSGAGLVQSKSVGSVSESYAIPQWMQKNPIYSLYSQNAYGRKYLSLIQPYITGNIILVKGATTLG